MHQVCRAAAEELTNGLPSGHDIMATQVSGQQSCNGTGRCRLAQELKEVEGSKQLRRELREDEDG